MAAIDKTRTDPPDKVEMGGSAVFSSPAANHTTPITAYQPPRNKQFKDSSGGVGGGGRLKGGEPAVILSSSSSSATKKQPDQHRPPPSTKTSTFQLKDNDRFLTTAYIPRLAYDKQHKQRQQQQQQKDHNHHHQQQQQFQPTIDNGRMNDNVSINHNEITTFPQRQHLKDLNSNTNSQFSPPGTVDSPDDTNVNSYNFTNPEQQHEPERLVNSSHNDPKEYKDNTSSWLHRPPATGNDNITNGQPNDNKLLTTIPTRPQVGKTTFDNQRPRHIDEVSVSSSSGTVLSSLERDPTLPLPRSSSPRLVKRQDHIEVPCDDVAIIDIENEEDTKIKSFGDTFQPVPFTGDTGNKSKFYIGESDGNPQFEDDISRINSVVNSDVEVTESSLVLPDVFSNNTCPTSGESSIRSSITEPQTAASGLKIKYRKQKKANKKKKTNGNASDQTDEEQSRSSGTKGTRGSGKNSSNWRRLRNTLKAANEMKSPKKANHPLTREDSFLRKFSTRNHNNVQNSSTLTDEESPTDQIPNIPTWTKLVIQHDGNFMFYWLGVVTLSVMYNLWTCIAREGFEEIQTGCPSCWYFLDGLFDIIYILDIVVQFRTGYLDQGLMVYDSKKLRQRYYSSKIIYIDFLCLLPLDFVQLIVGVHPMLRFPRFLKIYRAFRFVHMLESRTAYPNFIRVVSLTHILFLGAHWFAAFYYMISEAEGFKGSWAYPEPVGSYADVRRKYLKSLYWSTLTLTTIGDLPQPENANE